MAHCRRLEHARKRGGTQLFACTVTRKSVTALKTPPFRAGLDAVLWKEGQSRSLIVDSR